jgi:hypothetical protein
MAQNKGKTDIFALKKSSKIPDKKTAVKALCA